MANLKFVANVGCMLIGHIISKGKYQGRTPVIGEVVIAEGQPERSAEAVRANCVGVYLDMDESIEE